MRTLAATIAIGGVLALVMGEAATSSALEEMQRPPGVTAAGVREHLVSFQRIADRNGGNRAAGTAGYDASASYVATRMRRAGYAVRTQDFSFPYVTDRSPPLLRAVGAAGSDFRANRDYATLVYSGTGRVEAGVVAVDLLVPSPRENASTSACESADFAGFPRGAVALVQRGTCTFRSKIANAVAAGASAVVVFNEGSAGRTELFAATLGPPQVRVPALAASFEVGQALRRGARTGPTGAIALVTADVAVETRHSRNVIAEKRRGSAADLVVAGAHLDSVENGAGINDNASGAAALLEIAEQLARTRTSNRLRFAWWGAEELGLIGSRHYVRALTPRARQAHALYLNLDMVGSPNDVLFVYDGDGPPDGHPPTPPGSATVEKVLARYLTAQRIPFEQTRLGGSSDHAPFATAGIPVGGLFTGASGEKSRAQAETFGGRAGEPYDPCYHRACDTLANVSVSTVVRTARAAAHALRVFGRDVSGIRRAR